jgi:hypothetical protein
MSCGREASSSDCCHQGRHFFSSAAQRAYKQGQAALIEGCHVHLKLLVGLQGLFAQHWTRV